MIKIFANLANMKEYLSKIYKFITIRMNQLINKFAQINCRFIKVKVYK